MEKTYDVNELRASIKNGRFTLDGSHLTAEGLVLCGRKLTSLIGSPHKIAEANAFFTDNKLTSLEGAPIWYELSVYFDGNKLTSLEGIHKIIKHVEFSAYFHNNPITSHILGLLKINGLKGISLDNDIVENIINKYLPLGDVLDCQEELIEAGYEEYAQL